MKRELKAQKNHKEYTVTLCFIIYLGLGCRQESYIAEGGDTQPTTFTDLEVRDFQRRLLSSVYNFQYAKSVCLCRNVILVTTEMS